MEDDGGNQTDKPRPPLLAAVRSTHPRLLIKGGDDNGFNLGCVSAEFGRLAGLARVTTQLVDHINLIVALTVDRQHQSAVIPLIADTCSLPLLQPYRSRS